MQKAMAGAQVQYCGHQGYFLADVYEVAGACVVVANGAVTPANINRNRMDKVTHHLVDFPTAGYWRPGKGIFVVPSDQVRLVDSNEKA